jgi:transcriptional regulator with XRE-family HTH domain
MNGACEECAASGSKQRISEPFHDRCLMATRTRAVDEAKHRWARQSIEIAADLRAQRRALGLTQREVARALGKSKSHIGRVERQQVARLAAVDLVRHAAVLGLRASIKLFPIGGAIRDAAQVRYITRFVERVGRPWRIRLDVPIPLAGDLRAVDVLMEGSCRIAVEVVTRLSDLQAMLRAAQLKQRDIAADRLIIVVAATHANRRVLAETRSALIATFDLDTQRTIAKLAAGADPGHDAIILLAG